MAKKNKIYVTTMYKFGDRESHSYVLYAGFSKSRAITKGDEEEIYRGRKYLPEVVEFIPGICETRKYIYGKVE